MLTSPTEAFLTSGTVFNFTRSKRFAAHCASNCAWSNWHESGIPSFWRLHKHVVIDSPFFSKMKERVNFFTIGKWRVRVVKEGNPKKKQQKKSKKKFNTILWILLVVALRRLEVGEKYTKKSTRRECNRVCVSGTYRSCSFSSAATKGGIVLLHWSQLSAPTIAMMHLPLV